MPPKDTPVSIVKIPLSNSEKHKDYPQTFKLMPILYLELIENKNKIKQDLINKNYVPPTNINVLKSMNVETEKMEPEKKEKSVKIEKGSKHSTPSITDSSPSVNEKNDKKSKAISTSESEKEKDSSSSSTNSDTNSEKDNKSVSSDNLSDRLKELLQKKESTDSKSKSVSAKSSPHSKFTPYDKYKSTEVVKPVPTLAELEKKGQFSQNHELRNIDHIPMAEYDEDDKKRELMFKFELLKKSYKNPGIPVPDVTIHTNLNEMQKIYDGTVRHLSLDSTVDSYKNYLVCGFMITEYFFGSFLGFDMEGFSRQQMVNMHSYEKLLIELGEKSYMPSGSKWPVELQLLFLIVVNAGMFIIGKMVSHKIGTNLMGMINNAKTNGNVNENPQYFQRPKRKMKGPDNIDEMQASVPPSPQSVPNNLPAHS